MTAPHQTGPRSHDRSPQRSVVTGGAGFIGSHVVDALLAIGHEVVVVDNLSTGNAERVPHGTTLELLDVADAAAVESLARRSGPFDAWYHLAAQADVRASVADPVADARTNVVGTIVVLEAARCDGAQVVFASTGGAIYGDAPLPTAETAHERPESPYAAAKLAAEKYVQMHARLYGLEHAIVRYANVYGPRQDPHGEAGVVAIFAGCLLTGQPATIFGDGTNTRDYVYVADVVEATLAAAAHATRGEVPVYNVGTGVETSVLELWEAMRRIDGGGDVHASDVHATFARARPGELARNALDSTLARNELGVAIDTPLSQGLSQTLAWLRNHTVHAR